MTSREIVSCIDLTSLSASDTDASIIALCQKARNPLGSVAAVCCYPQFLSIARMHLPQSIALATVVNFPSGNASLEKVAEELRFALLEGADEIDLVIPYQQVLQGDFTSSIEMVKRVKAQAPQHLLKVIIESGELQNPQLIFDLSLALLDAQADFIKTSTGKTAVGATADAVGAILNAIRVYHQQTGALKGLKVSGGIKAIQNAKMYMHLAEEYFGKEYLKPSTFRIGASSLLDELLQHASS